MLEKTLTEKLRGYLAENNPDLLLKLQGSYSVTTYLEDKVAAIQPQIEQWVSEGKPQYVLEELCMNELTADLRPSRFNYLKEILEEEFIRTYEKFREAGVLTYELVNMTEACKEVFDKVGFTEENKDDRMLRYAIIGTIEEYL